MHLHTDYSNCTTNIDSVTKIEQYIDKAKSLGMTAMAVSEHGNIFNWFQKKQLIEKAGIKYIHAVEAYVTETIEERVRDNRHALLIAKNYGGFLEINQLVSNSYNRNDGHFYYAPRITLDELLNTSDNIIVTSACLGGLLNSKSESFENKILAFFKKNKHRCFLEIQHHMVKDQITHNKKMYELYKEHQIPLLVGTDTHSLNEELAKARVVLQKAKGIHFDNEDGWDLTFKTYNELVNLFEQQGIIPKGDILQALKNTMVIADSVEPFELNLKPKYPKLYPDSVKVFRDKVYEAIDKHPYALKNHTRQEIVERVEEELPVYEKTGTIDFMLFQKMVRDWEHENGIYVGYGRGSVSGSFIAYLLEITEMDSIKFNLNFFRFLNPSRVTNCDIDSDYYDEDRFRTIEFLLTNPNIKSAKIITFQTIAAKGSIREIARALEIPLSEADKVAKTIETQETEWRSKYPELFYYVDLVNGVITNTGVHAAGVLCSDLDIEKTVGICSSKDTPFAISCLDMYGVDGYSYVKFDCLGLDNVGIINKTCELAGIPRINPDNIDLEDKEVWKSIRDDTCMIFQWESPFAAQILKSLFSDITMDKAHSVLQNLSTLKLFSFGNGLIRPGCASFRNDASKGIFKDNGLKELNELLANEFGYLSMQETIMRFLVQFCGYSDPESDNVRRAIAKKKGTEQLLPEIENRFIEYTSNTYGVSVEKCKEIIKPFIQSILDASSYGFSWNHSDAYSALGYALGYLRYYYPLEFVSTCLNIFKDKKEKTAEIMDYCKRKRIKIHPIKFGKSRAEYFMDKDEKSIYKGIGSIKFLNYTVADELYDISAKKKYSCFVDLLLDINSTSLDTRQLNVLTRLGYFSEFGNVRELLKIVDLFDFFKQGAAKSISKSKLPEGTLKDIVSKYSTDKLKSGGEAKSYTITDMTAILQECEEYVKSLKLPDLDVKLKIADQQEFLGYISATGKEEDRPKLLVQDIFPVKRKKDGVQFGYSFVCQSIGSGIQNRFTVLNPIYQKCGEVKKNDIIYCLNYHTDNGYFRMDEYTQLF